MPDVKSAWTKTVVTDVHVRISLPEPPWYEYDAARIANGGNPVDRQEVRAKHFESEAKELEEFLRDHRSRDQFILEVIREKQEVCKFCGSEAEVDEDGEPVCCDKATMAAANAVLTARNGA